MVNNRKVNLLSSQTLAHLAMREKQSGDLRDKFDGRLTDLGLRRFVMPARISESGTRPDFISAARLRLATL
jgi:hypothetical protein